MSNKVINQAIKDYNPNVVSIDENAIINLKISEENKSILSENEIGFLSKKTIKESIRFLIALNSINYQFWSIQNNEFIRYQNKGQIGALGLFEGFVSFYNYLEKHNFNTELINKNSIFEHFGDIPDFAGRIQILKESFNNANFELVFLTIEQHIKNNKINVELADKIATILPQSYSDPYLKKIQLALYEIAQTYISKGTYVDCDITVAADYQIPKVLEGLGILNYSSELSKKINNLELIEEDSLEEKSLRAATILACDEISKTHNISIPALDRLLWLSRNEFKQKKFHLTKTNKY